MPRSKHQSRANAYKHTASNGKLKSVRATLGYKYGILRAVGRLDLPVRLAEGFPFEDFQEIDIEEKQGAGEKMLRTVMRYYTHPEFQHINEAALLANRTPLGLMDLAQQLGLRRVGVEKEEHRTLDNAVQQARARPVHLPCPFALSPTM